MRRRDDPVIIGPALCAAGCGRPWEKWRRKDNLVYCAECLLRKESEVAPPPASVKVCDKPGGEGCV